MSRQLIQNKRKLNRLSRRYDCRHHLWTDALIKAYQAEIDALRLLLGLKPMWSAT